MIQDLTAASTALPNPCDSITPYTAVRVQSSFHIATNAIYRRVISKPFPTTTSLISLDTSLIDTWLSNLPSYFTEDAYIPQKYSLAHAIMMWRYRNLRIIMYRPFVIRRALNTRQGKEDESVDNGKAYDKCLDEAKATINAIADFWTSHEQTRLGAWYALYVFGEALKHGISQADIGTGTSSSKPP
jgi:transcriptional regulatory protein GAL4